MNSQLKKNHPNEIVKVTWKQSKLAYLKSMAWFVKVTCRRSASHQKFLKKQKNNIFVDVGLNSYFIVALLP